MYMCAYNVAQKFEFNIIYYAVIAGAPARLLWIRSIDVICYKIGFIRFWENLSRPPPPLPPRAESVAPYRSTCAKNTNTCMHACVRVVWFVCNCNTTSKSGGTDTNTHTHTHTKNNAHRVLLVRMAFNCLKSWGAEMTTNIMNCWKPHCTDKSLVWTAKPCTPFACTMCVLFGTTKLKIHSWK